MRLKNIGKISLDVLSSGEKQRAAVAFVYAMYPTVFVFDEPTANLDKDGIIQMKNILVELKKGGYTLLIAEHRLSWTKELADRYLYMEDGKTYTAEINAKKGEVSYLKLLTTSVPVNIAKKLNFAIYDTEGVDVTSSYKSYVTLKAEIPAGKGFFDDSKNELKMFDPTATAKITMTYQEGAKKVESTGTVSVTNQSTETAGIVAWNLSQPALPLDWNKANSPAAHSLGLNTVDLSIDVKVKTSDGKEFKSDTEPANFSFKSADAAVFTMMGKTINPVAKGSASIIVEFTYEGKVSRFTPVKITIGENAKPQSIELNQNSVTVKKGASDDTTKIKLVRDQYGNIMNYGAGTWTFTANPAAGAPTFSVVVGAVKVDATGAGVVEGSNYTIKAELTLGADKTHVMFGTIVTP